MADIDPGGGSSQPTQLTAVGTTLFLGRRWNARNRIVEGDGTSAGTMMLKDIYSGWDTRYTNTSQLLAALFEAWDGFTDLLWKVTNPSGTVMVKDITSGDAYAGSYPHDLTTLNTLFMAEDATHGINCGRAMELPRVL